MRAEESTGRRQIWYHVSAHRAHLRPATSLVHGVEGAARAVLALGEAGGGLGEAVREARRERRLDLMDPRPVPLVFVAVVRLDPLDELAAQRAVPERF